MRLPLIRQINKYMMEHDAASVEKGLELLEFLAESNAVKDEELDVLGEMMSNIYGAIEVNKSIKSEAKIDLRSQSAGVYFVRISGPKSNYLQSIRLIKQ